MGALNRSLRVVQAAPASHFDRSAGCLREIHSERLTGHCFLHPRAKRGGSCPTTDPEITEKLLRCLRYDANSFRINALRPSPSFKAARVLFLGDSFVQGYNDPHTLPHSVWEYFRARDKRIDVLNAGVASYSTAIYIVQAKRLLPRIRTDAVVVVFDVTDLWDDVYRYEHLIDRNGSGEVIAVRPSPAAVEFRKGFVSLEEESFFLSRFFQKLWHTYIRQPLFVKGYESRRRAPLFFHQKEHVGDPTQLYRSDIDIFERNVRELSDVLIKQLGSPVPLLFVSHPHLGHFATGDQVPWNRLVAPVVEKVAQEKGIIFYDAFPDLRQRFGGQAESLYWEEDMHFNFEGIRQYGQLIARRIISVLSKIEK